MFVSGPLTTLISLVLQIYFVVAKVRQTPYRFRDLLYLQRGSPYGIHTSVICREDGHERFTVLLNLT